MLPGLRFLFAAIVLATSLLVFGLGAAALFRAAHEEFASIPARQAPPEPQFAHPPETPPVLAMMRVDPPPAGTPLIDKVTVDSPSPSIPAASEPTAPAEPPPATEPEKVAAVKTDDPPPRQHRRLRRRPWKAPRRCRPPRPLRRPRSRTSRHRLRPRRKPQRPRRWRSRLRRPPPKLRPLPPSRRSRQWPIRLPQPATPRPPHQRQPWLRRNRRHRHRPKRSRPRARSQRWADRKSSSNSLRPGNLPGRSKRPPRRRRSRTTARAASRRIGRNAAGWPDRDQPGRRWFSRCWIRSASQCRCPGDSAVVRPARSRSAGRRPAPIPTTSRHTAQCR